MLSFVFEIVLFALFVITCLYLPGRFLTTKLKLTLSPHELLFFPIGIGLGIVLSLLYVLSWINLSFLTCPILIVISLWYIKTHHKFHFSFEKRHRKPLIFVLILSFIFSLSMLVMGVWGDTITYRHDDPWHLALINELKVHFPPDNPGIAGRPLHGYHFFYNMLLAQVSNAFFLSPLALHFHLFPVLIAFLWGTGAYALLYRWSKSISTALWGVSLTMFGGSFAFILSLQGHTEFSLDSGFGMAQPADSLYNPPLSLSIVFILVTLFALHQYLTTREKKWLVPIVISTGMIAMVKVYAAIILAGGLAFVAGMDLLKKRTALFITGSIIAVLFLGTFWVFAGGSGSLSLLPLWGPHHLLQSFSWYHYDEKILAYTQNSVILGILKTEGEGLFLFLFGNLGTRLIGLLLLLILLFKKHQRPSLFSWTIIVMLFIALFVPLFFIQSGKVFEIIQMTEYYTFFVSLFAAFGFAAFFRLRFNPLLKGVTMILVVILTLPSAVDAAGDIGKVFDTQRSLTQPYFRTTAFLAQHGNYDSTVLELPSKNIEPTDESLRYWYGLGNPAIGAFSNKRMYFNNQFIDFPGVDVTPRYSLLKELVFFVTTPMRSNDPSMQKKIIKMLQENKIHYIYSTYDVSAFKNLRGLKRIFSHPPYVVYEVAR